MSTQNKDYDLMVVAIEVIKERVSRLSNVFDDIDPDTAIVYRCHGGGIFLTILADTTVHPELGWAWFGIIVGRSKKVAFDTWERVPYDCKVKADRMTEIEDSPDSELTELFRLIFSTYKL